uniref:Short-chain dehydrogenase/reductase ucsE n=1 Tax=Acremonium sp. TaxID=2046025 RepID=UCSE_ACRSP|nr:RecName: Full=Short-chain dehydrogenase/reductase ucsE; AltName: Full=UCS1025A pyrrolizidinone biosynthesis cluster protein E [Acremonium sp.]QBC88149.1 UcsE [Acremonium sp.]
MATRTADKLEKKLVVVVGGTSGLGFAVAQAAVDRKANVVVASSKQASVDDALSRLQAGLASDDDVARVRGLTLDLAAANVEEQIVALYDFASKNGQQKIDHIAVTAGDSLYPKALDQVKAEDFINASQVRVIGALLLAKHAAKYLAKSAASSFTLTSGVRDVRPAANFAPVAPVSAAVKSLAKTLAHDLAPIRVNSISPGAVRTEFFTKIAGEHADAVLQGLAEQTLTKSNGVAEDIAEIYLVVMTSAYIDGADLVADGGSLIA